MRDTMIDGLSGPIRVVEAGSGDGTPVLFAHSFGGSSAQWSPQLSHASETRRAAALDLHGHGRSDAANDAPYDVRSFADDIATAADGLGLKRFVLVGHSLGGAAAISYAADCPQRLAGLMLVATPGRLPDEQVRGVLGSLDKDYDGTMTSIWKRLLANATPATRRTVEDESDRMSEKVARRIIGATFEFDPVPGLEAYGGPRLTISTPQAGPMQELHELVAGVDHETVEGTSHWIQLDDPEWFNEILDRFLARVDRAEAASKVAATTPW
jgi:pimeloyl-ACP methyl ester carboxylesterase